MWVHVTFALAVADALETKILRSRWWFSLAFYKHMSAGGVRLISCCSDRLPHLQTDEPSPKRLVWEAFSLKKKLMLNQYILKERMI
ncbi:hypothetical protein K458DRAFT_412760, partial [Lentithecium fluviatile CBS 122367]